MSSNEHGRIDCVHVGQLIGSFRVTRKLGEGGMGSVFAAVHQEIGFRAAIKFLHAEYSQNREIAHRFLNEARAVNIIQHPGLVKIFEFGKFQDRSAYIIMEYLEGERLDERLEDAGGSLPIPEALRLCRQIASVLTAVHKHNIIHRDLKPANVILVPDTEASGRERVKLLDFGLAKLGSTGTHSRPGARLVTRTGVVMGTAMYMSPEQCRSARDIDGKADVYALGVMMYEMLSGQTPFLADSEGELVTMHLRDDPPELRSLAPEVPEDLARMVHAMLAKNPADRLPMAEVLAQSEALGEAYGEPASRTSASLPATSAATPASSASEEMPPQRHQMWYRVSATVVLLLFFTLGLTMSFHRPTKADADVVFTTVPSGTRFHLRALFPVAGGDIWAVGDAGTILHWNGTMWNGVPSGTTYGLRGIWGSSPHDVWATGGHGTMLHWNGLAWSAVKLPSEDEVGLRAIWGSGPSDAWAVGEQGMTLHFDGKSWASVPSGITEDLRSVWGSVRDNMWAAGEYGVIVHYDGTAWSRLDSGTTSRLARIWGHGDEVWALGNDGTILHRRGTAWDRLPSNTAEELSDIWGPGADDLWAVGNTGTALHFDGKAWRPVGSGTRRWLYGVSGVGENLWAVGTYGTILRHRLARRH